MENSRRPSQAGEPLQEVGFCVPQEGAPDPRHGVLLTLLVFVLCGTV